MGHYGKGKGSNHSSSSRESITHGLFILDMNLNPRRGYSISKSQMGKRDTKIHNRKLHRREAPPKQKGTITKNVEIIFIVPVTCVVCGIFPME